MRFRGRLVQTYQQKGYAKATVEVSFVTTPDEEVVSFAVTKGDRYAVGKRRGRRDEGDLLGRRALRRFDVETGPLHAGRLVEGDLPGGRPERSSPSTRRRASATRRSRPSRDARPPPVHPRRRLSPHGREPVYGRVALVHREFAASRTRSSSGGPRRRSRGAPSRTRD